MKCTPIALPGGGHAIVCGSRRYDPKRCVCGAPASKLCDWIVERAHPDMFGIAPLTIHTCDAAVCDDCTTSPAPGKDLCREHASAWAKHPANAAK